MIQAVIFDMDGLMFDTERLMLRAWSRAAAQLGYPDMGGVGKKVLGLTTPMAKQVYQNEFGMHFPFEEMRRLGSLYREEYLSQNGVPVKPGLMELLAFLRRQKLHTAVATSTSRKSAIPLMQRAGVLPYLDRVVCGDALERSKPAPDIYLSAAALLGISPHACLALEDSPNGIRSASAAGMKTVMIPDLIPFSQELKPLLYACVDNLFEIIALIQTQNAGGKILWNAEKDQPGQRSSS